MMRVAVTGGIACGKSMVGSLLKNAGWAICEADEVAHRLYAPDGPAYAAVRTLAGRDAVTDDGHIDRSILASTVFGDPACLAALNSILHPLVRQEMDAWMRHCEERGLPGAAVIVPLLFEAGMAAGWDAVLCIGCSSETQRQRLRARGLGDTEIAMRIAAQWPLEKKMAAADYQIWNDGSQCALESALKDVIRRVSERN